MSPHDAPNHDTEHDRNAWSGLGRGLRQVCPACNEGALYKSYLKVNDACPKCGTELHHHRADDAPPYFVMTITGHIIIGGILMFEKMYQMNPWLQLAIWSPITILLTLWLLPRIKGALIGYQWALKMHGFGGSVDDEVQFIPDAPKTLA